MNQTYWQKQQPGEPLYPNLLWSRPETKRGAGKLLVIGGQAEEFSHVAESYAEAENAGAGTVRVIMPDSTEKFTRILPNIEYAPANSSGSFAKSALAGLLDAAAWADCVLLAGDLGKNSETGLMLESFIYKCKGTVVIAGQALQSLPANPAELLNNEKFYLAGSLAELQKILKKLHLDRPLTSGLGDVALAEYLHQLGKRYPVNLILIKDGSIWTARSGRVASTAAYASPGRTASYAAVWTMQQPAKPFEAMVTAAGELAAG